MQVDSLPPVCIAHPPCTLVSRPSLDTSRHAPLWRAFSLTSPSGPPPHRWLQLPLVWLALTGPPAPASACSTSRYATGQYRNEASPLQMFRTAWFCQGCSACCLCGWSPMLCTNVIMDLLKEAPSLWRGICRGQCRRRTAPHSLYDGDRSTRARVG